MKGPQRQKQTQEQNEKKGASSVGLCQDINRKKPPREGQPVGTSPKKDDERKTL